MFKMGGGGPTLSLDLWYQLRRLTDLPDIRIDDWFFRLHYWVTSTALFLASAIAFAKQYFGDPIECIFDAKEGNEMKAVDAYCWLHSTFNLDYNLLKKMNENPKIRNPCKGFFQFEDQPDTDTLYYQWVPFFLLLQALTFRISWRLWQSFEGGRMEEFGLEAKKHLIPSDSADIIAKQYALLFRTIIRRNNSYFAKYFFCEVLNVVIVIWNIYATDGFLGGKFVHYGSQVWRFYRMGSRERKLNVNPMCALFPTVTSCQFPSGAVTGSLNVDHAMCVLSLNIINDKIFLLEWFWFFTLLWISLSNITLSFAQILFRNFRRFLFLWKCNNETEKTYFKEVFDKTKTGDWFFLSILQRNTNSYMFKRIIKCIAEQIKDDQRVNRTRRSSSSQSGV
ncbi:innexin inx2 [Lepeophtheirus salmonis]|uniref:Innexin n=1 Tax=Lepeophtheirus salmonis TaxID=72036 RepID=A0A0K2UKB6_LEPSM|nr:innexin inx2-like [Lepeophtheirus salmonis]XP_040566684.1 innexin inx2-like [Lepeophtheirus salmonis]